jgi:predicted nucleic acid-binding protein
VARDAHQDRSLAYALALAVVGVVGLVFLGIAIVRFSKTD